MSLAVWIGVAGLGGFGALARFGLDALISARGARELPFGTFIINISGAFLLGLLTGLSVSGNALILEGTATLGSYTTFSTWMLESERLREEGAFLAAAGNVIVSLVVGFAAAALGRVIGAHG